MEKIWFILQEGMVAGPFTVGEIDGDLELNRWSTEEAKIWWKGQKTWIGMDTWKEHFDDIVAGLERKPQEPIWYIEVEGEPNGPMRLNDLISHLRELDSLEGTLLWRKGLENWTSMFELEEIVTELGLQRRTAPRAPVTGKVIINPNENPIEADIAELSEGGFAIKNGKQLEKDALVTVSIQSPSFQEPINSKAKVIYVREDGTAGLQFDNLHIETKSNIIDYVRQFFKPGPQIEEAEESAA